MREVVYWLVIALLSIGLGWQVWHNVRSAASAEGMKKELLSRDSLIRINDSLVSCLVYDLHTYRSLAARVPRTIKVDKPILVSKIEYVYVTERDTITILPDGMLEDFYPDANDWVIRHWMTPFTDGTFFSDWEFKPVLLDLVINERQKGLYEAQLAGPSFLQVRDLKVNSLPIAPPEKTNGILVGGGVGYDWKNKSVQPILNAGYSWSNNNLLLGFQLNSSSMHYIYKIK